jgi:hypothetical protein
MSNHTISANRGKSGPRSPRPHLLIDAATKSVTPNQKKAKIKAFLDEFRDQIKSKCDGQNVEYGGLKTYLTQKQANYPSYCDISWDSLKSSCFVATIYHLHL